MFTGIIEAVGFLKHVELRGGDKRLNIDIGDLDLESASLGDSIAVNGVCLTIAEFWSKGFVADVSVETLSRTTLGDLVFGAPLNLERAMLPTTRFNGHLVSGHVDGVGQILERNTDARSVRFVVSAENYLIRYIAEKGSITLDGISLTVNWVGGTQFGINVVPHTLEKTTLGQAQNGHSVNLEVDIIARYLERLLKSESVSPSENNRVTRDVLARFGYLTDKE